MVRGELYGTNNALLRGRCEVGAMSLRCRAKRIKKSTLCCCRASNYISPDLGGEPESSTEFSDFYRHRQFPDFLQCHSQSQKSLLVTSVIVKLKLCDRCRCDIGIIDVGASSMGISAGRWTQTELPSYQCRCDVTLIDVGASSIPMSMAGSTDVARYWCNAP